MWWDGEERSWRAWGLEPGMPGTCYLLEVQDTCWGVCVAVDRRGRHRAETLSPLSAFGLKNGLQKKRELNVYP